MEISPKGTVGDLKFMIHEKIKMPTAKQVLLLNKAKMDNSKTISGYLEEINKAISNGDKHPIKLFLGTPEQLLLLQKEAPIETWSTNPDDYNFDSSPSFDAS